MRFYLFLLILPISLVGGGGGRVSKLAELILRRVSCFILPFLFRTFLNSASFSNIFYKLRLKYEPFFPFLKNHKQDGLIKESDIKR